MLTLKCVEVIMYVYPNIFMKGKRTKMKKLLSILLAVVLCFSVCSVVAFAANEDIIVSAKGGTAQRGGTIRVPISLDANKGFVTLGLAVDYDSDVLEIVCEKHEDGKSCTAKRAPKVEKKVDFQVALDYECSNAGNNSQYHTVDPYLIQWAYGTVEEDICETGEIAAITFKVKDNAKFGDTKVTVTVDQASGFGSVARTFAGGEATVTVACTSHTKDEGTVTKEPTCTEKGTKTYKCKDCGAPMGTEDIKATGHDWGNWEGTADAKCGQKGQETRVCKNDANHKETRDTDALEHLWDAGTVTKEPTCTEKGTKTFKCTRKDCDGTKTEDIKALGHAYGEWTETTAPECEKEGEETRVCANDANHKETRPVDALGHEFDYENGVVTVEPTCTEEGEIQYPCINGCGVGDIEVLDPLGHDVEWTITKEATTTEKGERTGTCGECGEEITEEIPMLTPTLEGDKLGITVVDPETGDATEKPADGFKVESGDDEPFSGYVSGEIIEVVPDEEEADTVDGKKVAVAYMIGLMDNDLGDSVDPDKVITLTIPVSEAVASAYENLVLVGINAAGEEVILENAVYADGAFTVTGKYGELAIVAVAGDKIVVEEEDDKLPGGEGDVDEDDDTKSPQTGDTATAVAFAIVMIAVACAALVVTSKKVRA